MGVSTKTIEYVLEQALKGKTMVVEVKNESELNSVRVRFYQARKQLSNIYPEIETRIAISQEKSDNKFLIILDKPSLNIVYERDKEGNLHKVNLLDERVISTLDPRKTRMLKLMVKDEVSEEEILQVIEGFGGDKEEALKFYRNIKN